jgi:hypothetical protein
MRQLNAIWLSFACRDGDRRHLAATLTGPAMLTGLVMLSTLAACAAGDGGWQRANTPPDQAAAALSDCRTQATADLRRDFNIDTDIESTHASDWRKIGIYDTQRSLTEYPDATRADHLIAACMSAKGFSQNP